MLTFAVGAGPGSLGRGFSERPAAVHQAAFHNSPSENTKLFPEFAAGGAAVRRVLENQLVSGQAAGLYHAEGLTPRSRVFILKAGWQIHLLHDNNSDLDGLKRITRGTFIEVLGEQSTSRGGEIYSFGQAGKYARPGHDYGKTINFPSGLACWDLLYRPAENRIFLAQHESKSIFEFPGFGQV